MKFDHCGQTIYELFSCQAGVSDRFDGVGWGTVVNVLTGEGRPGQITSQTQQNFLQTAAKSEYIN